MVLRGDDFSRHGRRSREAEHLYGLGAHATCPPSAVVYRLALQLVRMFAKGHLSVLTWDSLWLNRDRLIGTTFAPSGALRWLDIEWSSALELRCGHAVWGLRPPDDYITSPVDPGEYPRLTAAAGKWKHGLRAFLRRSLARRMATMRPRDYGGLENGPTENIHVRRYQFSLMHRECSPSLLSEGQWTQNLLYVLNLSPERSCPRCGGDLESLLHRLWHCPCNAERRLHLQKQLGRSADVLDILPTYFAHTGAVPANFSALDRQGTCHVLDYLWWAAADGTYHLAHAYRGKAPPTTFEPTAEKVHRSFRYIIGAMPPMRRTRADKAARRAEHPLDEPIVDLTDGVNIYTDGSHTPASGADDAKSGWGFVTFLAVGEWHTYNGVTIIDSHHVDWQGARIHSNNTAELSGIYHALQYVLDCVPRGSKVQLVFDSRYAAYTTLQLWAAKSNTMLVKRCIRLAEAVGRQYNVSWRWVRGHSQNTWNERADEAAKRGADGHVRMWS